MLYNMQRGSIVEMSFDDAVQNEAGRLERVYARLSRNGLTANELFTFILLCGDGLGKVVEAYQDVPREERESAVVMAGTALYFKYDPDIPLLPNFIEPLVERELVPVLVRVAYRFFLHKQATLAENA